MTHLGSDKCGDKRLRLAMFGRKYTWLKRRAWRHQRRRSKRSAYSQDTKNKPSDNQFSHELANNLLIRNVLQTLHKRCLVRKHLRARSYPANFETVLVFSKRIKPTAGLIFVPSSGSALATPPTKIRARNTARTFARVPNRLRHWRTVIEICLAM